MKYFLTILFLITLGGCTNSNIHKNVQKFIGQSIIIPTTLKGRIQKIDTVITIKCDKPSIMVYYNFQGCKSCKLKELTKWKKILIDLNASYSNIDVNFIINTRDQLYKTTLDLLAYDFDHVVYFDINSDFENKNTLPQDPVFHTFLLDKNNKVVLVGSPVNNPKMWDLYKSTLKRLTENGGILPR